MQPISMDPNLARKLDLGMKSGESVELPFPIVYIWALNGQASYKSQGGALYYGGWACKAEDLQQVADQQGLKVPADWKHVTIASRDGGEFEAYTTRHVIVAPIGKRESWMMDNKRSNEYIEGGRRHLQVLAYLAEAKGQDVGQPKQFIPWGPVVLTAKGYQARNLLDAFARWNKVTSSIRWQVAPGVPAWCFYLSLGTFGKERQAINVGKPGAQSPITPIGAYISERLNDELVASLFVGNEVAALMSDLQDRALDWLEAWKHPQDANGNGGDDLSGGFQEIGLPEEDEIPF